MMSMENKVAARKCHVLAVASEGQSRFPARTTGIADPDQHHGLLDVVTTPDGYECRSVGFCLLTKCTCRTGHGSYCPDKLEGAALLVAWIQLKQVQHALITITAFHELETTNSPFLSPNQLNRSFMHSLGGLTALRWLVFGLGAQCARAAVNAPTPTITPAPTIVERQDPNAYVEQIPIAS